MKSGLFIGIVVMGAAWFCTAAGNPDKTVVTVDRGQVRVETASGSALVDAGQKAVMTAGEKPLPGVSEPLIEDVLKLNKLAQAERAAKQERIDGVLINVCSIESDKLWKAALLTESVNSADKPVTVYHIGNLGNLIEPRFYDMQGRLLKYDWKKGPDDQGPCDVHMLDPVAPGSCFRLVCVGSAVPPPQCLRHEGKVWHAWQANDSRHYLNYFRFILPPSGMLVESNREPLITDVRDGRLSLTIRNYTGKDADGEVDVAFLWPDKDGSSLEDIPARLRGGQDVWQSRIAEQYGQQMALIESGQNHDDQSTPLATLLTRNAAILRGDRERMLATAHVTTNEQRKAVVEELEKLEKEFGGLQGLRRLLIDPVKIVRTSEWPAQPAEGAFHKIVMYGSDPSKVAFTMGQTFSQGKWYIDYSSPGPAAPNEK